jgi:hypothetical protein
MDEMLSGAQEKTTLDPQGSLIDADMGACYTWLNERRLPGADQSSFLAWFEDPSEAPAISPSLRSGTESTDALSMGELLAKLV